MCECVSVCIYVCAREYVWVCMCGWVSGERRGYLSDTSYLFLWQNSHVDLGRLVTRVPGVKVIRHGQGEVTRRAVAAEDFIAQRACLAFHRKPQQLGARPAQLLAWGLLEEERDCGSSRSSRTISASLLNSVTLLLTMIQDYAPRLCFMTIIHELCSRTMLHDYPPWLYSRTMLHDYPHWLGFIALRG